MNINASLLISNLQKKYALTCPDDMPKHLFLKRPFFYEMGMEFKKFHIYIVKPEEMPDTPSALPSSCFFLFVQSAKTPAAAQQKNNCFIHTQESPSHIFNSVQTIFDFYDHWEQTLVNIGLNEGSIQSLLNASYPVFKNPLHVMGMDFSIIASTDTDESSQESFLSADSQNYIEYITALKQDSLFNSVREKDGAFLFPGHISGFRSLNVNIKRFSKTTHRLSLFEQEQPFLDGMESLLEFLAALIKSALLRNASKGSSKDKSLHSIFLSALSDRTADYIVISQSLTSMGWLSSHKYLCIVLQVTYVDQQNLTSNAICNYLENLFSYSCVFQFKEYLVAYINLTKSEYEIEDVSDRIIYFIRDSFLKAGYSRAMHGHLNLRRQYIQACAALEVGSQKNPFLWSHHFNTIAMPFIYQQATKKLPGYMICHEKLLALLEIDRMQKTEYIKTLSVYLDHNLNAVQSAKALFIHRSTFLYRLDKIKDILETDLDDPEELMYLMLSLRIMAQDETEDSEEK